MSGNPLLTKSPKDGISERMSGIEAKRMETSAMVKKQHAVDGKEITNHAVHAEVDR